MRKDNLNGMRFHFVLFLFSALVFTSLDVQAQTNPNKVTRTQAQEFYEGCLSQAMAFQDKVTHQAFCACASANFYEKMKPKTIEYLNFPDTRSGKYAYETLMISTYRPCMPEFITDVMTYECQTESFLDEIDIIDKRTFCECKEYRLNKLITGANFRIMRSIIQDNEIPVEDPISSYVQDDYVKKRGQAITDICYNYGVKARKQKSKASSPLTVVKPPAPEVDYRRYYPRQRAGELDKSSTLNPVTQPGSSTLSPSGNSNE